ncbi:hypothetical protein CWO92_09760 [Heyndrickxia camelliae]|uniref:Uncharacterized protein n=1 Tax=Heyndrickxia camelliae TaxID=1707093 RepID=A0A2N3LLI7_9BACI|nr:hypothetical protein CWO92_09760 [Heyndrickxia camelliae]
MKFLFIQSLDLMSHIKESKKERIDVQEGTPLLQLSFFAQQMPPFKCSFKTKFDYLKNYLKIRLSMPAFSSSTKGAGLLRKEFFVNS